MDNTKYFYISGVLSLSLFLFFALLFSYMIFSTIKIKSFGLKKENYISVSIVMPKKMTQTMSKQKIHKKKSTASVPVTTAKKIKDLDVNDLFSDVWTQKINHKEKKKKINAKRLAQLEKKIKKTKNNEVKSVAKTIEIEPEEKKQERATSTAQEVNEYLAKIQALVYESFHVPPNTAGHSVKTIIKLDPLGKVLDFRVLQYSNNEALNQEVDRMKARLIHVIFPKNPNNETTNTTVVLISKE